MSTDGNLGSTATREALKDRDDMDEATKELLMQIGQEEDEDRALREQALQNRRYKCEICLDDDCKIEDMVTLSCDHRHCRDCFANYLNSKISEARVAASDLVCPSVGCGTPITNQEMKANVSNDVYEKYDRFMLKQFCQDNPNYRACPHCNEWFADIPQDEDEEHMWKRVECEKCRKHFCGKCGQQPHKGQHDQNITCEEYAKWQHENANIDESMKTYLKTAKVQCCPQCKSMAELVGGGCKFTYCQCKARFCFICGVQLQERHHYSHFTGPHLQGPFGEKCHGQTDPGVVNPMNNADAAAADAAVRAEIQRLCDMQGRQAGGYAAAMARAKPAPAPRKKRGRR